MLRSRAARIAAALVAAAALARLGTAVLTEFKPIFPDYYYNDARLYDASARQVLAAWSAGDTRTFLAPGTEAFAVWVAVLYRTVLPAPLVAKVFNALLGACTVALWAVTARRAFGPRAGLLAGALLALWPSHVFYTAQSFKEAPTLFLMAVAFWGLCSGLAPGRPRAVPLAAAALSVALLGFLRAHILPFMAAGAVAGATALLARRGRAAWPRAAAIAGTALAGALLYKPLQVATQPYLFGPKDGQAPFLRAVETSQAPGVSLRPDSPGHIAAYREVRLSSSQIWARQQSGRDVETLLFPGTQFATWLDVAAFLPKVSFYQLFMPLPLLYPTAGKPGRVLSAAENSLLMLGALAAAAGFRRSRSRPAAWLLAAFFVLAVPPSALFEFDLGSASRHRLQTLSALVPLAAAALVRRPRRRA